MFNAVKMIEDEKQTGSFASAHMDESNRIDIIPISNHVSSAHWRYLDIQFLIGLF